VWTLLYILMGLAFWRMWRATGGSDVTANVLFAVQLSLNLAWSLLFFNAQNLQAALLDVLALLGVLSATTLAFYKADHTAGYMLMPYLAWVAFATALTASIYFKNSRRGATEA
jgi:tryptophan-rich sensory protein